MAIGYQVFSDVSNVTFGAAVIHGVQRIVVARSRQEVRARGDGDLYDSLARAGGEQLSGSIELLDPAQAAAVSGAPATLSFTWRDARRQQDKTVTITGVSFTGAELSSGPRTPSGASLRFLAESSGGITDPLSVS